MKKWFILAGLLMSFIAAIYDIMAGIYLCVLTNGFSNWIMLCRQKSKTTIKRVKKERPMTVDEFREREMEANPHRPYPRHNPHDHEFTD
jgi:hypothetical protein